MEECNGQPPRAPQSALGWNREAVTYRLTPTRKRGLLKLLGDCQASPTDALDMAIERAAAAKLDATLDGPGHAIAPTLNSLRDQICALTAAAEEWAGVREALALVAEDCAQMRRAVASAAVLADGVVVNGVESISDWLSQTPRELQWIVFKLRWLAKRPDGAGTALWDVELREFGRAGAQRPRASAPFRATLGPCLVHGPVARLESIDAAILCCARSGHGWALTLRSSLEDGKLGEQFAELLV